MGKSGPNRKWAGLGQASKYQPVQTSGHRHRGWVVFTRRRASSCIHPGSPGCFVFGNFWTWIESKMCSKTINTRTSHIHFFAASVQSRYVETGDVPIWGGGGRLVKKKVGCFVETAEPVFFHPPKQLSAKLI